MTKMLTNQKYLNSVQKQFVYYKTLAEKAIEQINEEQLFVTLKDQTNSIAVIIKHLSGNMLSRWTDFLISDGEKPTRNRDDGFINTYKTKEEVLQNWNEGWKCFFNALNNLEPEHLWQIIYIRNEGHSVLEAINRQLAHYSYHIGQIVFYAKILKTTQLESLSIPKINQMNIMHINLLLTNKYKTLQTKK